MVPLVRQAVKAFTLTEICQDRCQVLGHIIEIQTLSAQSG